ncbi:hypothetical protein Daesc_002797 [Daldinia eschscholtzii]|uniref:DUF7730 domain-containing protein n=1 Tax=Daldinia eschscholtzii TaxID=292717 RepID=A0AAX6MRM3_9PEZI
MDASSSSLVNPDDPNHPLWHVAQQNDDVPFFNKLSLEVRLMIYEFAVAMDGPVRPKQVEFRSNKFFSDQSKGTPSTVVHLGRTCRRLYQELENYPVFYRVNTFQFRETRAMLAFMAAIHPKRLSMIYNIRLMSGEFSAVWYPHANWGDTSGRTSCIDHILALLSRCKNLRNVSLVLDTNYRGNLEYAVTYWDALARGSHTKPAFINLPGFKVFIRYGANGREDPLETAITQTEILIDQSELTWGIFRTIARGLRARESTFARMPKDESDESDKNDRRPQWLKDLGDEATINKAIKASEVDFPGDKRIAQDIRAMSDHVSSRTRRKAQSVDELGVLRREVPLFDGSGLVAWRIHDVEGARWNDSGEVELKLLLQRPGRVPELLWVPLDSYEMNREGEEMLLDFFRKFKNKTSGYCYWRRGEVPRGNLEGSLHTIRSMPSPAVVAKLAGGAKHFVNLYSTAGNVTTDEIRRSRIRAWDFWSKAWENFIPELERGIRLQKRAAKKAAREAAKAQKAAEKAAKVQEAAEKVAKAQKAASKSTKKNKK